MSPSQNQTERVPGSIQDVVIVGGGVVGCAMARQCVARGFQVTLLEKAVDILDGSSKANSAILHTGFDAPVDSLEQQCIADGYRQYLELAPRFGLPILRSGALVVAWNGEQAAKLDTVQQKAVANGVQDVEAVSHATVRAAVPDLAASVVAALTVPGEFVIDPWTTPYAYLLQAMQQGARLVRGCEVLGGTRVNELWQLTTSRGALQSRLVINCAGLFGDIVEQRLTGSSRFEIKPRKGQFVVFDKAASALTGKILLPVPEQHTKGIVVCPTIFGNLLIGPTAEEQADRSRAAVDRETLLGLQRRGEEILPRLRTMPVTATYAGLRPATEQSEYRIHFDSAAGYVGIGGIRSTGLSAALGIASFVSDELEGHDRGWTAPDRTIPSLTFPPIPALAERDRRDWQQPDNGGIVCHCELVTHREIDNALRGPLAATSLAGLKRRTRATLGRCQGFYCSAALSELTKGKLSPSMSVAKADPT